MLLTVTDMTQLAQLFPTHSGPTLLLLNFDGAYNDNRKDVIAPYFNGTQAQTDQDIQQILYQTSEIFAPFNVEVQRYDPVDNSPYPYSNGTTLIDVGADPANVNKNGQKIVNSYTPGNSVDYPNGGRGYDHAPNSDAWDTAYVDPLGSGGYQSMQATADNIAHEAGHTFGLTHVRTDIPASSGKPADSTTPLGPGTVNEMMSYTDNHVYFANKPFLVTDWNNPGGGKPYVQVPNNYPGWNVQGTVNQITTQNSFTYLTAALGPGEGQLAQHVVDQNYVDPSALSGAPLSLSIQGNPANGPAQGGGFVQGLVTRQGDYEVYNLTVPGGETVDVEAGTTNTDAKFSADSVLDPVLFVYQLGNPRLGPTLAGFAEHGGVLTLSGGQKYAVVVGCDDNFTYGTFDIQAWNATPPPPPPNFGQANPNLAQILNGRLMINGGPSGSNDTITLLNFPSTPDDPEVQVQVTGTGISGYMVTEFPVSQFNSIQIDAGDGTNSIFIQDTPNEIPTYVTSHGHDTVTIGDAGSVAGIQGPVYINNDPSLNTVIVDDSADKPANPESINLQTVYLGANVFPSTDTDSDAFGEINGLAPANIYYEYADTRSVTIKTPHANNTVNIYDTGTTTYLDSGGDSSAPGTNDTVNVGLGDVQGIQRALYISNPPAWDIINVDASSDSLASVPTITLDSITPVGDAFDGDTYGRIQGLAPANILYDYNDTKSITITDPNVTVASLTNPTIVNVLATGAPVTTRVIGTEATTFNVGNANNVQGIRGSLFLDNAVAGMSTVNINDSADTTTQSQVKLDTYDDPATGSLYESIQNLGLAATIYVQDSGVASLALSGGTPATGGNTYTIAHTTPDTAVTLTAGNGGDQVNVHSTAPGTTTHIVHGGGQDQVNVTADPQTLGNGISSLFIDPNPNGTGSAALSIDDSGLTTFTEGNPFGLHGVFAPQSVSYTESAGELQRTATFKEQIIDSGFLLNTLYPTATVDVRYDSVRSVTVNDNLNTQNPNTFTVVGTRGTARTELQLQRPNDTVQIGDSGFNPIGQIGGVHSLEYINNVDVQGTAGSVVTVDDKADHAVFPDAKRLNTNHRVSSTGSPTYTLTDYSLVFANQGIDTETDSSGNVDQMTPFAYTSNITFAGIGSLVVQGSSQLSTGNTFNVQSTLEPVTINAGSNGDTIHAGDTQFGLGNISAPLTAVGTGDTLLVLDDWTERNGIFHLFDSSTSNQLTNRVGWVVTNGLVMRNNQQRDTITDSSGQQIGNVSSLFTTNFVYSGISGLTLDGGPSGNHFYIQSTAAATPVTINSGSPIAGDTFGNNGTNTVDTGSDLLPGIVSYYAGEGNANDGFGANDGTVQGNITYGPGHVGQGFQFDGVNGSVSVPADSSMDVGSGGGLTLAAWINPTDVGVPRPILEWTNGVHLWESGASGEIIGPGDLTADLPDDQGNGHLFSTAPGILQAGQWQFVALTYDKASGLATLYLNGQVVAQQNLGSFNPVTNTDLTLGRRQANSFNGYTTPFSGGLDDVGIYSRALTSAEIQTLFTSPSLNPILSTVTVNGQGGTNTLNVHDESTSSTEYYNMSANGSVNQVLRYPYTFGQQLGNPTQTINYVNIPVVNVHGGGVQDVFGIQSTIATTSLSVFGGPSGKNGTGGNVFIVENASDTLDDIHGPVAIHGGSIYDFAYLYDGLNTVGHNYTLTSSLLTRDNGTTNINISYDGLGELILPTGDPYFGHSPSSTVNVLSTAANTGTFVAVGGGDRVNVGEPAGNGSTSTLQGIQGELRVQTGDNQLESATVKLDDSGDTQTGQNVMFNTDSAGWGVSGLAPSRIYFNLGSGSSIQVAGGSPPTGQSLGNTFNIQAVPTGVAVTLTGGTGKDMVNVGSSTNTLDPIQGPLTVNGNGSQTTLNINDKGTTANKGFEISANAVERIANTNVQPYVYDAVIKYAKIHVLNVTGGTQANVDGVVGTAAGTITNVYSGSPIGAEFTVTTAMLNGSDALLGPLAIHGSPAGGVNFLQYYDYNSIAPHTYTMASGVISRLGLADLTYDHLSEVDLWTARLSSGNTVNVPSLDYGVLDNILFYSDNNGSVTIGSGGSLAAVKGSVEVGSFNNASDSHITVTADDHNDPTPSAGPVTFHNVVTQGYDVQGLTPQNLYFRTDRAHSTLSANLLLGAGNKTFDVNETDTDNGVALSVNAGSGNNTVQGPNAPTTWQITGSNAVSLPGGLAFTSVENLRGGTANDTFQFQTGGSVSGTLNGGGGTNTLDYSAYVGNIVVDLLLGTATGVNGGANYSESNIQNVTGSQGNDLIVGDANANVLKGGTGRNVIISGGGADSVTSGGGDNLLIAGTTAYDSDPTLTALDAIFAEWTSSDPLGKRMHDVLFGGGQNGNYYLDPAATKTRPATVFSNPSAKLFDGTGLSWFFVASTQQINNGGTFNSLDRVKIIH